MERHLRLQPRGTLALTAAHPIVAEVNQFFQQVARRAAQISCGLTGHAALLRYESSRLSLQCTECGHESPGWDLQASTRTK
jgi:hypothetical protein